MFRENVKTRERGGLRMGLEGPSLLKEEKPANRRGGVARDVELK